MISRLPRWLARACLLPAALAAGAAAGQTILVEDIRVEGLQRISPGRVFNDLPITVGDTVDEADVAAAIKTLFATGLYDDVRIERRGAVLVVVVAERPSIAEIEFAGNRILKTEDLTAALERADFKTGRTFDPALFDRTVQELRESYFSQGRYSAEIEATVTPLERNRVAVRFDIDEGEVARIRRINIVGNEAFEEKELLDLFESSTPTAFSWFSKAGRYSKQVLAGDLERLRTHYLDRGYIHFSIDSTQVSITPDRGSIHITINVTEGQSFRVGTVELAGDLVVAPDELFPLVDVREGEVFNRSRVTETTEAIKTRLGDEGYAFANVNAAPEEREAEGLVDVNLFIDPGQRVYVRRIVFRGNHQTRDEVLRREMRQLEGAWVVNRDLARSRQRLLQLGHFDSVRIDTEPVPGASDRVDVVVEVVERRTGTLLAGVGYSQEQGAILDLSLHQENLFGGGNSLSLTFDNSSSSREYAIFHSNPYYTPAGISRTLSARFQETEGAESNIARYTTDAARLGANFGFPVNEYDRIQGGLAVERIDFTAGSDPSRQVTDFERESGGRYLEVLGLSRWSRDSRDRRILARQGGRTFLDAEVAVPGSELTYYRLRSSHQQFAPVSERWTLMLEGELGYGDAYGATNSLPLTSHFFAGGPRSVRGFEANSLGPRDSKNLPLGGDLLVQGRMEGFFALPFVDESTRLRLSTFLDMGNVFEEVGDFDGGELRFSTGLSMVWFAAIGVITTSWGYPLNEEEGDEVQRFQFTIGTTF